MIDFEGRVYAFLGLIAVMVALILTGQMESYNYVMTIALGLIAGIILPVKDTVAVAKVILDGRN